MAAGGQVQGRGRDKRLWGMIGRPTVALRSDLMLVHKVYTLSSLPWSNGHGGPVRFSRPRLGAFTVRVPSPILFLTQHVVALLAILDVRGAAIGRRARGPPLHPARPASLCQAADGKASGGCALYLPSQIVRRDAGLERQSHGAWI